MKFYGMVGHNPKINRLDYERAWPKVKVTRGQKIKIILLPLTPFKNIAESAEKLKCSLFDFLTISIDMIMT